MVVFVAIRQSPAYLHAKTYCLCILVTLFQAQPVSSRLPRVGETLHLSKSRILNTRLGPRVVPVEPDDKRHRDRSEAARQLVVSPQLVGPWTRESRFLDIPRRWYRRALDLASIKSLLRRDDADLRAYPELQWDAAVRRSSSLHRDEARFVERRKQVLSSDGSDALRTFLDLPPDHHVDPRHVPLIALGGSGGGYRAMYGLTAFIRASKRLGLWDCVTWVAGVSGSCWTIAAYYTMARCDVAALLRHYLSMASEVTHPMSVDALNTVARSSKGVYFLLGPLVRKTRNGIIGLGVMDLYATLTTTYQFISRESSARLSRATFQWSKVWSRAGIDKALQPMPILTAVRRAPQDSVGVKPHTDSSISKGKPPQNALAQHQTNASAEMARARPLRRGREASWSSSLFQWFEISPLEIGSPEAQGYVPTWSWGRTFAAGRSVGRAPEQSLALLLGQCTSAPAGPLTAYISALLATMPTGTFMSRLLLLLNNFVQMKRWERLWGNPIRAAHEPNPFYGLNTSSGLRQNASVSPPREGHELSIPNGDSDKDYKSPEETLHALASATANTNNESTLPWESQGRVRLMDSGMSNNLPNHILARPERGADVLLSFDTSSDVQTGSALRRIHNWADDCNIELEEQTTQFQPYPRRFPDAEQDAKRTPAQATEARFYDQYAKVFKGVRENGQELYLVYCPLLPSGVNPDFNPSTASFSTSYNLVWTPGQIKKLFATTEANLSDYAIHTVRQVVRKVYEAKRERQLDDETKS